MVVKGIDGILPCQETWPVETVEVMMVMTEVTMVMVWKETAAMVATLAMATSLLKHKDDEKRFNGGPLICKYSCFEWPISRSNAQSWNPCIRT